MLAHLYIPRLSNDMRITVHKNYLGSLILYTSLDPSKKRRRAHNFSSIGKTPLYLSVLTKVSNIEKNMFYQNFGVN